MIKIKKIGSTLSAVFQVLLHMGIIIALNQLFQIRANEYILWALLIEVILLRQDVNKPK
jgi:hypothetical protein